MIACLTENNGNVVLYIPDEIYSPTKRNDPWHLRQMLANAFPNQFFFIGNYYDYEDCVWYPKKGK